MASGKAKNLKRLNLALQGGGAHGAFTWGVLDRLMRDGRIFIDGISAGAMNGVVFTDGFIKGGRRGAIDSLHTFWKAVSDRAFIPAGMLGFMPGFSQNDERWNVDSSPAFMWADAVTRMFSPYQINPLNLNPLRDILGSRWTSPPCASARTLSCSSQPPTCAPVSSRYSAPRR